MRRPRVRERIPRAIHPNFRDDAHASVTAPLLRLLQRLQRGRGEAWASESGLRQMICEDTGHMPGVGTIPAALDRMQSRGLLEQVWILAGSILPTGETAHHGTRGIHVATNRGERQAIRAKNKRRPFRERRVLKSIELAQDAIWQVTTPRGRDAAPLPPRDDLGEKRARDLARLAQLEKSWKDEPPPRG